MEWLFGYLLFILELVQLVKNKIDINKFQGLNEKKKIFEEMCEPTFPYDFPDTLSYKKYALMIYQEKLKEYQRKPPAKRINYSRLLIKHPFFSPWDEICFGIQCTEPQESDLNTPPNYYVKRKLTDEELGQIMCETPVISGE